MKHIFTLLVIFSFGINGAHAIYAPRPMGMGGAYTAIADDVFAAYWNPAGLAVNPNIELAGSTLAAQRNQAIGDNMAAIKMGFETELESPFAWMLGVGAASLFALEGAKYLSDQGIVKKGWGREGKVAEREEAITEQKEGEGEEEEKKSEAPAFTRKEVAKMAAEKLFNAGVHVAKKFAKAALKEAVRQTRHYYYAPPWYHPYYYRPSYWDNRYDYEEKELTPANKAQFAAGIAWLTDRNADLNQNTNWYTFSLATAWEETAAIGANLNIYDIQEISSTARGLGAGFDLGALLRISDKIMFGLNAREILTTDIQWDDRRAPTRYNMEVNAGAAVKPFQQITIAADAHNIFTQNNLPQTIHYGIEVRPIYGLALRAGISNGSRTAGASIGIGQLIIDYAYLGGAYNQTQMIGASWKL